MYEAALAWAKLRRSGKYPRLGVAAEPEALRLVFAAGTPDAAAWDGAALRVPKSAASLRQAIEANALRGGRVVLTVAEEAVLAWEIVLPPMDDQEVAAAARWEAEARSPGGAAQYWDFSVLEVLPDGGRRILLAAAPRPYIDGWVKFFAGLPAHLAAIEIRPLSAARFRQACAAGANGAVAEDDAAAFGALLRADAPADRLNLLPPALRGGGASAATWRALFAAGAALLCVLVYAYGAWRIAALEEEVQQAQSSYRLLEPTVARQSAFVKTQDRIARQSQALASLSAADASAYALLLCLGRHAIPGIRLTDAELHSGREVILKGTAREYPRLAQYVRELASDALLETPELTRSETPRGALEPRSFAAVRFELRVRCKT